MVIHICRSKGDRDRYTMLPQRLLLLLREYWRQERPPGPQLFTGRKLGRTLCRKTVGRAVAQATAKARIRKRVTPHSLRHIRSRRIYSSQARTRHAGQPSRSAMRVCLATDQPFRL
jgi:integrase/recombinase XerD